MFSVAAKGLYDLYVTTYETVKSEEEFFVEQIPHWQCIVLGTLERPEALSLEFD